MSFTVRLIFWGLVGFVPTEEPKGMTALLVNPDQAQADIGDAACAVPSHFSAVYLIDGKCQGDCQRVPKGMEVFANLLGFNSALGQGLDLKWLLNQEDLIISDDEDDRLRFRAPLLKFIRRRAPKKDEQASYFSWVQNMDKLTRGRGKVRPDCLTLTDQELKAGEEGNGLKGCPLNARFRVEGGRIGACHLFHHEKSGVRIFEYSVPGGKGFETVVADAVLVEFEVEGDAVTLASERLPGRRLPAVKAEARLRPNAEGVLTLIVGNFPPRSTDHQEASHKPGTNVRAHSDVLFNLLEQRPKFRAMREEQGAKVQAVKPGSCEPEADFLARLLSPQAGEPPHSTTACDGGNLRQ